MNDTQPKESKSLLEEKLKKVTTERAPVAGMGRSGGRSGGRMLDGLVDSRGIPVPTSHDMLEMLQGRAGRNEFNARFGGETPGHNAGGSGAAAAAGVLTAVDEDGDGDEEANVPDEFDYFTDSSDFE